MTTPLHVFRSQLVAERAALDEVIAALDAYLALAQPVAITSSANTVVGGPLAAPPESPRARPQRPATPRAETDATTEPPKTKAPRKAAGEGKWHKSVPDGHWREQALKALAMGHGDVQVRELATRLRIQGPTRDRSIAGLWNALQILVKAGQVEKHGPLYRLPGQASGRGEAA